MLASAKCDTSKGLTTVGCAGITMGMLSPRPSGTVSADPRPAPVPMDGKSGAVPTAPDLPTRGTGSGRGSADTVPDGLGDIIPIVIPAHPTVVKPLLVSHLAEANILYRVQPSYPSLARQVRVQGTVELRAIISKAGTIENLVVVRGHPMLVTAAVEAVKQWRYRPYLLNKEPIEVETEITVNFVLSGS